MPILRPHSSRFYELRISSVTFTVMLTCRWAWPARFPICRFWTSERAKFTKMGDFLPWMPMNRREKFDAASFILGAEIRNRTNTQKTNTQTLTDISTPCLSACVDKKRHSGAGWRLSTLSLPEEMSFRISFKRVEWNLTPVVAHLLWRQTVPWCTPT